MDDAVLDTMLICKHVNVDGLTIESHQKLQKPDRERELRAVIAYKELILVVGELHDNHAVHHFWK